jgi:ligand-binding SRPBCC domain-containing protein
LDLIERKSADFGHATNGHRARFVVPAVMEVTMMSHPFSAEARGIVEAPAETVFAFLDDQANLSSHMSKPSSMMLGTTMKIVMEPDHTKRVGSRFGFTGTVLGVPLKVEEVVTSRTPPSSKTWETTEEPTLWVIGQYRMGFELVPQGSRTQLRVHIRYARPAGILGGIMGWLLAPAYARWCTRVMVNEAVKHFGQAVAALA